MGERSIGLAALDLANGHGMSSATETETDGSLRPDGRPAGLRHFRFLAPFNGYVKSLKNAGVRYNSKSHGWDISEAHFSVKDLQTSTGKTSLNSALALFLSKNAMEAISDPFGESRRFSRS